MADRKAIYELPESLKVVLDDKKLITGRLLIFAEADMDADCEFRDHFLLLTENELIHGSSLVKTDDRAMTGIKRAEADYTAFEFKSFSLSRITSPAVDTFVVGGRLRLEVDGKEQALLGFTNAYKGRVDRLCGLLRELKDGKTIEDDRLYEEQREEFCPKCGTPYPDKMRRVCPKCMDRRRIFLRLGTYFKPYAGLIAVLCVLCILNAVTAAVWPVLNGSLLYDNVLAKNKANSVLELLPIEDFGILLLILALTMAGTKLLQQLFGIIQGRIVSKVVPDVVCTLKKKVFSSIQRLSVSFFTGKQTGGLMTRIMNDAGSVSNIFIDGIPYILPNLFTIVFSCIVMFSQNWIMALTAVATLPITAVISMLLNPIMWHYNSRQFQTSRDFRARMNDTVTGARVVKAFGAEERQTKVLALASERAHDAQLDYMAFDVKYSAVYHIAQALSSMLVWLIGSCFVLAVFKPQMTYGTLMTFTGYVGLLSGPVDFFSYIFRWWASTMNSAQRIFEILDAEPTVTELPDPIKKETLEGSIALEKVTFGYEENREVIKDMSLKVEPGKMLGIVGKSGAGKTTLANLITRLYDPNSGKILLDGIDLRDMAIDDVRRNVALVSQETYIFRGSIYENIAYAVPGADRESVIKAAIAASAHDFICRLPDGYDTLVGAGGRALSGGERQRVSMARAILSDPKILILDEATAAVDTETEKNIQASLKELIKGRTTLSIAHRISTLRDADELIVIEDGRITEQGTHSELVRKKGAYYKLLQIQSEALKMRGIGD